MTEMRCNYARLIFGLRIKHIFECCFFLGLRTQREFDGRVNDTRPQDVSEVIYLINWCISPLPPLMRWIASSCGAKELLDDLLTSAQLPLPLLVCICMCVCVCV
jgi:hypothetical protein